MKLTFIGSGSAFTIGSNNFQSNMILENNEHKRLLIDCGTDARFSLDAVGLSYRDITDVYISHLHADHCGGLEWLGFTRKFDPDTDKPNLYISDTIADELWNRTLAGGMHSLQGTIAELNDYFNPYPVKSNGVFHWEDLSFQIIQTVHIMNGFSIVPSFGLMFTVDKLKIFITTDTQFSPGQIFDFYQMADDLAVRTLLYPPRYNDKYYR